MKNIILISTILFFSIEASTQPLIKSCEDFMGRAKELEPFTDEQRLVLTFFASDKNAILKMLDNSFLDNRTLRSIGDELAKAPDKTKKVEDLITKAAQPKPEGTLQIVLDLTDSRAGDSTTLILSCNGKIKDTIPLKKKKEDDDSLESRKITIQNNLSYLFIPPDSLEAKWLNINYYTKPNAPLLNKHTRWAIVYDYTKQDPVAVWKRTNKVAGTTCDESIDSKVGKRNKKKKQLSDIAKEIYQIDTTLSGIQKRIIDAVVKTKADKLKRDIEEFKKTMDADMSEEQTKQAIDRLLNFQEELKIIKALNAGSTNEQKPMNENKASSLECCDKIYCIKEVKRLAPTVGRSLLVSVINYHPYRDSFVFAIDYNDRFVENAALFSSAFNNAGGLVPKATPPSGIETGKIGEQGSNGKKATINTYKNLFDKLGLELKQYYESKFQQERLDVSIVANAVGYIKSRMADTSFLGVTDFSEAGIIKRAEELAEKQKSIDPKTTLDDYFKSARNAAYWFAKVANYRVFDSKSILIQNRDVINLTLNKYHNGQLKTISNEALRSYHTSGGFKIDFSVGLFGSGLINKSYTTIGQVVMDTAYFQNPNGTIDRDSIVAIDSVEMRKIIKDDLGKFDIGPAIFLHGYWRTGIDINISGTFGLSINQSGSPRFLLGLSALFGKDSRWVISGGGAWSKIKDLASGYEENQVIPTSVLLQNSTLPTKDVWKSNLFIAVSWNFGGFTIGNNR